MELKEIVAPSCKSLFIREFEDMILSGRLKAGDKLPSERDISVQMKIPRSVVSAGLAELEQKGFVTINPRKGTIVADYMRSGNLQTLAAITEFNGGYFDKRTFESIMELRMLIEPYCAYLAAKNRTDADIEHMEEALLKAENASNLDEVLKYRDEFHSGMYCASNNTIFPLIYNAFKEVNHTFAVTVFYTLGMESKSFGIRELLDAIRDRDCERARECKINMDKIVMETLRSKYFSA
ncbi:MAG: FadR family transcriptional regulator [Clostridiales bacterium]|jgi:GntR family transcriptional repressor for pyruvate dehydrogenase complex|nr:FadR family transcriptional regulator [Clostridiales bacterium]